MERNRPELSRHCLAVTQLLKSALAAVHIEVSSWEMDAAAMLHDYGKILWTPDLFIKNIEDLSLCDLESISSHPMVGRWLVSGRWPECPETVLRLIEFHHCPGEWFPAQLLAACDVWVACHEDRPYRTRPVPERVVLHEMLKVAPERVTGMVLYEIRSDFAYGSLLSL
jgi:HD-GYP domain-containing protein (c-di-GMP phosphodiesterase class II)